MRVKLSDIRAAQIDEEFVCIHCTTKEEIQDLEPGNVFTEDDIERITEDELIHCDRCGTNKF